MKAVFSDVQHILESSILSNFYQLDYAETAISVSRYNTWKIVSISLSSVDSRN